MSEQVVTSSLSVTSPGRFPLGKRWPDALPWWGFLLALVFIAAAVISRKPSLVFHAQFIADEGLWFADAYINGALHSLFQPQAGYLCIASKLPVVLALHVPLVYAPVVFGVFAAGVHALMAGFLLTSRLAHVASLQARTMLCVLCIAIPNCSEIDSLNDTQWMLAALAFAVLVSTAPKTTAWRVFDVVSISLISVTGPFSVLLLPFAVVFWAIRRTRWTVLLSCLLAAGASIQILTLAHAMNTCRPREILDLLLIKLSAGQIFLFGTLNGGNILTAPSVQPVETMALATFVLIAGISLAIYALLNAPLELKLFVCFAALVLAAALRRLHCDSGWDWQSLMSVSYATRYWYIPRLAVLAVLVWMVGGARPMWLRAAGIVAIFLLAGSAFSGWRYPAWPDQDFPKYAHAFEHVPAGTQFSIPVNPPGWKIILVKH